MTRDKLKSKLDADSSISEHLSPTEIFSCCDKAAKETGWAFPVTGNFKELWVEERAMRHCYFKLWTQSARKFKVEQLNLNQRFDHYGKIIEKMDKAFEAIQEAHPEMFVDAEAYKAFGDVKGPGFIYDITGKDVTKYFSQ